MKLNFANVIRTLLLSLTLLGVSLPATATHYYHHYYKPTPTIKHLLIRNNGRFDRNSRDYDILVRALIATNLLRTLGDRGANFTLLAPNDRAFLRLARELGFTGYGEKAALKAIIKALSDSGNRDPIQELSNILLYHVVPERQGLRELATSQRINTLLEDETITPDSINLIDNEPDVQNPRYIYPVNVRASNGIIHSINRVLLPVDLPNNNAPEPEQNIIDIVALSDGVFDSNNQDFDILLNAIQMTDLVTTLSSVDASLTVFAPDDDAFILLARDIGYEGFEEQDAFETIVERLTRIGGGDPVPLLRNILLYHVSPETKTVKQITDQDEITTLLSNVTLRVFGTALMHPAIDVLDPRISSTSNNIRATNGIIHSIDRVLIPFSRIQPR